MRQGWQERTEQYLLRYFDKPGLDVAVVGNGPISHADRKAIAKASKAMGVYDEPSTDVIWCGAKMYLRIHC